MYPYNLLSTQCAEEVVSVSLGLVDFAVRLMSSVLNLPEGQVTLFGNINHRRAAISPAHCCFLCWLK